MNEAKSYTDDEEINDKLVEAHKTLFTLWADIDEPQIFDYAWREWGGFIGEFYYVRWKMFFDFLKTEIQKSDRYDAEKEEKLPQVYGREAFFANEMYKSMADFEISWTKEKYEMKKIEKNDLKTYELAKKIYELVVSLEK